MDQKAAEWAMNLSINYRQGLGDTLSNIIEAAKDLGIPYTEVDKRWQLSGHADLQSWKGMYFILTGKTAPGGYTFA